MKKKKKLQWQYSNVLKSNPFQSDSLTAKPVSRMSLPPSYKAALQTAFLGFLLSPQYLLYISDCITSSCIRTCPHTHTHTLSFCLIGFMFLNVYFFSALWTWWWLVRAHQFLWKEILLQLQDRSVPVGEAQRMAGEVAKSISLYKLWLCPSVVT